MIPSVSQGSQSYLHVEKHYLAITRAQTATLLSPSQYQKSALIASTHSPSTSIQFQLSFASASP
jgi:hypothetical protein